MTPSRARRAPGRWAAGTVPGPASGFPVEPGISGRRPFPPLVPFRGDQRSNTAPRRTRRPQPAPPPPRASSSIPAACSGDGSRPGSAIRQPARRSRNQTFSVAGRRRICARPLRLFQVPRRHSNRRSLKCGGSDICCGWKGRSPGLDQRRAHANPPACAHLSNPSSASTTAQALPSAPALLLFSDLLLPPVRRSRSSETCRLISALAHRRHGVRRGCHG